MQALRLALLTAIVLYASASEVPTVKDLDGQPVQLLNDDITVLVFTRSDCPLANRYVPELVRISKQWSHARFLFVYVDPKQSVDSIRAHLRDYNVPFEAVVDPLHQLVRLVKATTTPEAAVFKHRILVYRGRIDDRQVAPGISKREASTHDLESVLRQVLAGKPVKFRSTRPIGCFIEDVR